MSDLEDNTMVESQIDLSVLQKDAADRRAAALLETLETRLLMVNRMRLDHAWADHGRSVHMDPFGRLYLLFDGDAVVTHHDQVFHLRPGWLHVIPAHALSRYLCPQAMDLAYVHFTATVLGGLELFAALRCGYAAPLPDPAATGAVWDRLHAASGRPGLDARLEADGLFRQLLAPLLAAPHPAPVAAAPSPGRWDDLCRLQPVFQFVERHLPRKLRLADLAACIHLQPTYFSNLFSRVAGMPPLAYVNRQRVRRAEALLWEGRLSLAGIAAATGLGDVFHFSKVFKRVTGIPPSRYCAQQRPGEA
jgi:AraC family transcriptional regulator, arabinose operon regulatory protein